MCAAPDHTATRPPRHRVSRAVRGPGAGTPAPGRHGITQGSVLYCFEPGGNRIEMFGDEGYLILEPDFQPVIWPESDIQLGLSYYGAELPLTGAAVGTPEMPMPDMAEIMDRLRR